MRVTVLALLILLAGSLHARAGASDLDEEKHLQRATELFRRGELKAADALVRERLSATSVFRFVRQYGELLARVRFESGDYRGAWRCAHELESRLDRLTNHRTGVSERLPLQLLLADIELADEQIDAARDRLGAALDLTQRSVQPLDRLEALVRLARLEEVANDHDRASLRWSQVRAHCEAIVSDPQARRAESETFHRAGEFLADALVAQKDFAGAVTALVRLRRALRPVADDKRHIETIRRIAEVHRQAEDYSEQRLSLNEALAILARQAKRDLRTEADIWRELGDSFKSQSDALTEQGDHAAADEHSRRAQEHWRKSLECYLPALARVEPDATGQSPAEGRLPRDGRSKTEPGNEQDSTDQHARQKMRLLFQIAAAAQLLEDWERAVETNEKLLAHQRRHLDQRDPEIHRTLSRLGTLLVRLAQESPDKAVKENAWLRASDYLTAAEAYWQKRTPAEPETHLRTVLFLADAREGSAKEIGESLSLLQESLRTIDRAATPIAPALRLSAYFRHGRILASQGKYAAALDSYQKAVAIGESNPLLGDEYALTLLNRAMLYKSQRSFDKAIQDCQTAVSLQKSHANEANSARLFPMRLALSGLYIAQAESRLGRPAATNAGFEDAVSESLTAGEREARHALALVENRLEDAQVAELWHQFALLHQLRYQFKANVEDRDLARDYWRRALKTQERTGRRAMQARSMNHLAEIELAELRAIDERLQLDEAAHSQAVVEYEADEKTQAARHPELKAQERQLDERRVALNDAMRNLDELNLKSVTILSELLAYPNLHYRTLATRAAILRMRARWADPASREPLLTEAIHHLAKAIALTETPREMALGGDLARAEFFAHYADAFEQLVELYVARGRWFDALYVAEKARNRTFLDQVRQAGGDIWGRLQTDHPRLHAELQSILAEHHETSQTVRSRDEPDEALLRQLADIRRRYFDLEVRIRRALATGQELAELESGEEIHRALAKPDNVVLYYYVTRKSTHLFVLESKGIQHFRLQLANDLPIGLGEPGGEVSVVALREYVEQFSSVIKNKDRAFLFWRTGDEAGETIAAGASSNAREIAREQEWSLNAKQAADLTDMLLPPAVRARVKQAAPSYVLIAPDGPLHQLPFEALPLDADGRRFVLDDFPPTAYAPSAQIIATMSAPHIASGKKSTMLVVGDVDRPDPPDGPAIESVASRAAAFTGGRRGGAFYRLKYSGEECTRVMEAVKSLYPGDAIVPLIGPKSTEAGVRHAMADSDRRIACLLFSCHGFAQPEQETTELTGSLVLSPSGSNESSLDDGFLELHEIHLLPLAGCELAVLSACDTISGPERPLESGSTLARSFMAAGARRVVCSHWSVDDESTAELIRRFFENAKEQSTAPGAHIDLAKALHEARRQTRQSTAGVNPSKNTGSNGAATDRRDFSSPFYWAPFVLVGSAKSEKAQLFGINP
jgi:CHAT domain-containing protein